MLGTYDDWKQSNWDKAHSESDVSALTGTGLGGHLATLEVERLLTPESTVLCIGVGMGDWVNDASKIAAKVWALDVSYLAKKKLGESIEFVTDPKRLGSDNFDLAMSLWVAPHMNNRDLRYQLGEVIRALKPGGTFAIHYKEPLDPKTIPDNKEGTQSESAVARAANMQRTRANFCLMVEHAGGYVREFTNERPSQFHGIVEVVAHITKGAN